MTYPGVGLVYGSQGCTPGDSSLLTWILVVGSQEGVPESRRGLPGNGRVVVGAGETPGCGGDGTGPTTVITPRP